MFKFGHIEDNLHLCGNEAFCNYVNLARLIKRNDSSTSEGLLK